MILVPNCNPTLFQSMKTLPISLSLATLVCLGSVLSACADDQPSALAGVLRADVPAGGTADLSVPLVPFGEESPWFQSAAADGARIQFWDPELLRFDSFVRTNGAWRSEDDGALFERMVVPGEAFRFTNPGVLPATAWLVGRVPQNDSISIWLSPGANLVGLPYPADSAAPPVSLAGAEGVSFSGGDGFQVWDSGTSTYRTPESQGGDLSGVPMGAGFWFLRAQTNGVCWTIPRPYDIADTNAYPRIDCLLVDPAEDAVTLVVDPGPLATNALEIWTCDNVPSPPGSDSTNWILVASLLPAGTNSIVWMDSARPLSGVGNRFYRVRDALSGSTGGDLAGLTLAGGLLASFHVVGTKMTAMPDFNAMSADLWTSFPTVDFPSTISFWSGTDARFIDYFACRLSGWIDVPVAGDWTFHLSSDDAACLWIDGECAISNDAPHAYSTQTAVLSLTAGAHAIAVGFFDNAGAAGLKLEWTPPGGSRSVVPATAFTHAEPANLPPGVRLAALDSAFYFPGNIVALSATPWDFDDGLARVDLFAGEMLIAALTNAPYSVAWEVPGSATGRIDFSAVATDRTGIESPASVRTADILPCPPGYAAGLSSTYYALSSRPGDLPDFSTLTAVQTRIERTVDHVEATAWPGIPVSATRLFASHHAGRLFVPATGDWTFLLESAEGSRLCLDGALVVDNGGAHTRRTRSGTVRLAYGFHDFEILHFTQGAPPTLRLHWQPNGSSWTTIPQTRYFHLVGNPDSDGDGIEDWWETGFGFDPSDPYDAALDSDGDGLSNLAEFLAGTNPLLADSDGDGIPDDWEILRGLDPCNAIDAFLDPDGDGLSNIDEWTAGTDPAAADSDGDGVSDWDERFVFRSDPLVPDISTNYVSVVSVDGSSAGVVAGSWTTDGTAIFATSRSGILEYSFALSEPGAYCAAVTLTERNRAAGSNSFELRFSIDGIDAGISCVSAAFGEEILAFRPLPRLSAGSHVLRIRWWNTKAATSLEIRRVELRAIGGPDVDGNGVPDWLDRWLSITAPSVSGAAQLFVSPACVEGSAEMLASVRLEWLDGEGSFHSETPIRAAGDNWYLDVPLAPGSPVPLGVLASDGTELASTNLVWSVFDLLDPPVSSPLLRAGDSLLIGTSGSVDAVSIRLGDAAVTNLPSSSLPAAVEFSVAGDWTVEAVSGASVVASLPVRVRAGSLGGPLLCVAGQPRTFDFPTLPDEAVLEYDSRIAFGGQEPISSGGRVVTLGQSTCLPLGLDARLGEEGPILDAAELVAVYGDNGSYWREAEVYPDGSRKIEIRLQLGAVTDNMSVELRVFVQGVTFDDGTLVRTLGPDDFDENGVCTYYMIQSGGSFTSTCHYTRILQNGTVLFDNN